jgi:Flp pilus assembly protein TadG
MIANDLTRRFFRDRRGAALVEVTLLLPFLLVIAAGVTEIAHAMHQQFVISKSVRDAARYAARASVAFKTCPLNGQPEWATIVSNTQNIAMRGKLSTSAPLLLPNWSQASTVTVTDACMNAGTLLSPAGAGTNIPVITVAASVPFSGVGFLSLLGLSSFNIQASHSQMWAGL